jgi:hypothetical protein
MAVDFMTLGLLDGERAAGWPAGISVLNINASFDGKPRNPRFRQH